MPKDFKQLDIKQKIQTFNGLTQPLTQSKPKITPLVARGNRKLQMSFEDQLNALILLHLEEYQSGRHLLQALEKDDFARTIIAPEMGIKKSAFFEAINSRGLEQLIETFEFLQAEASKVLPKKFKHLGELIAIDGSLIDATLSMHWADYRTGSKKAKTHIGFDVNRGIPQKIYLTDGKADERPFASQIITPGQTGVMDRYYQCHKNFDAWQADEKHFVCRIRANTIKTVVQENEIKPDSIIFYDAVVLLGTKGQNQTEKPVRVVGYKVDKKCYWVATDRFDLEAEEIAQIYKLRWDIETFFGWWKRHLKVYHIIARSRYGLMVQIISGLITYLLLAIYCHEQFNEKVSIKRVREIRIRIKNEFAALYHELDRQTLLHKKRTLAHAKL